MEKLILFDGYEGDNAVVIGDDSQEIKVNPKDMIPVDRRGERDISFSPYSSILWIFLLKTLHFHLLLKSGKYSPGKK